MKCGDLGHVTVHGAACEQNVPEGSTKGCLWHSRTPAERQLLAVRAGLKASVKTLPKTAAAPEFGSREAIVKWAQFTARLVLAGELSPRLAAEGRQLATLALQALAAETTERLVEALVRIENGGTAFLLLQRLTNGGTGTRQPLPGRLTALVEHPE